ncbi:CDGSH iron-sulfur domain-containing protein [Paenibacillus gyeongsangnamensis]
MPLLDPDGNVYEVKDPYFLCRCGHSTNRPFCTGAHKAAEFHDASRAK